ncbi:MAG: bifunctional DNA primase/polymerase [Chloroflexota bacterium]|nr:bifunctional DNA primase/polymerase [Chloroflexota bacterium]
MVESLSSADSREQNQRLETVLDWALEYERRGFNPTPNLPGLKVAYRRGWQSERLSEFEIRKEFTPEKAVGLVLGEPSGGLVCADLDSLEALALGDRYLPETGMVDGRLKKPRSHRFYRCPDGLPPHRTFTSPKLTRENEGKSVTIVELLSARHQAIVPPSRTKDGEYREWDHFEEPATIGGEELVERLTRLAVHAELSLIWPLRGQHHVAMALVGGLLRAGWEEGDVLQLVEALCPPGGDGDMRSIVGEGEMARVVADSIRRLANDEHVYGWPKLAELTGEKASVDAICDWLGVGGVDRNDDRPRVHLSTGDLAALTEKAWTGLAVANEPAALFQSGGKVARINLVQIRQDGKTGAVTKSMPVIERLDVDGFKGELAERLSWLSKPKPTKANPDPDWVKRSPPNEVVQTMLSAPSHRMTLPVVSRVVSSPLFGPDGSLETAPGYHRGSQSYYYADDPIDLRPVSAKPTKGEVEEAKGLILDELFRDFPFVGPGKAHALAFGLLPFGRDLIDGPTPLHFIDAPSPGTGKDKLVQAIGAVVNGRRGIPYQSQTADEDEWRKVLVSSLMQGAQFFYVANLTGLFKSAVLDAAITGIDHTGRILSKNDMSVGEIRFVWVFTGNNATLKSDTARRTCPIRLDANQPKPWERTGFAHVLPEWALANRAALVWSFLTLWQNWLAEGRPKGTRPLGSFEEWAETIGGVLQAAGVEGFLSNLDEFYEAAVDDSDQWEELAAAWWDFYGSSEVQSKEVYHLAEDIDGFAYPEARGATGRMTMFGNDLKTRRDAYVGAYRVRYRHDNHSGKSRYRLEHPEGVEKAAKFGRGSTEPTLGGSLVRRE